MAKEKTIDLLETAQQVESIPSKISEETIKYVDFLNSFSDGEIKMLDTQTKDDAEYLRRKIYATAKYVEEKSFSMRVRDNKLYIECVLGDDSE